MDPSGSAGAGLSIRGCRFTIGGRNGGAIPREFCRPVGKRVAGMTLGSPMSAAIPPSTVLTILLTLLTLATPSDGQVPTTVDSVVALCRNTDQTVVCVEKVRQRPLNYRAWIACTFDHPMGKVEALMTDFENYPKVYKNVQCFQRIVEPADAVCRLGTYYGEGRAPFVRVWGVGNIDSMSRTDSTAFRLYVSQNQDERINAPRRHAIQGFFTVEVKNLRMTGCLWRIGTDRCRAAVIAQGDPIVSVPPWIFTLAIKVVMPRIIRDTERELCRRKP
jgi:hypothetical protein